MDEKEDVTLKEEETLAEEKAKESPYKSGFLKKVDNYWGVSKLGSSFKIEIFAGIATFLAMAYILTVNPNQILNFDTGDPKWASVFIATAFGAVIGTLLMAFLAKMPFAQASGMGLNSMTGLVIGGFIGGISYSYGNAMLLILISGVIFLVLSIVPVGKNKDTGQLISLREKIFDGMPKAVRLAIPVGIGFFIAFIGFQNAHIIVDDQYTLVSFVDFKNAILNDGENVRLYANSAIVALFGLAVIAVLSHYKVKGAVIIGVLIATLLAWPLGVADINNLLGKNSGISWKFWENFKTFFSFNPDEGGVFFAAFTDGFKFPAKSLFTSIMLIITFCMIDMFDTMGTVVGCATNAGLIDENGKPNNYNKIMYSDSIATCTGALLGTSTVTTFVESGAGVAVGGKTGMTAFIAAILFLLSIFFLPVFAFIPSAAAASALIWVGVLMIKNVKNIDFHSVKNAVPAFLTIIMMVLCYSITDGIGIGIISYVVLSTIIYLVDLIKYAIDKNKYEKPKWDVSIVAIVVTLLFLVYFIVPTSF